MVTMDDKPLFIDTNILIYANVATAPFHEQALNAIKSAHQAKRELWISRQVLREFIATRTRPQTFAQPSTPGVLIEKVKHIIKLADPMNRGLGGNGKRVKINNLR